MVMGEAKIRQARLAALHEGITRLGEVFERVVPAGTLRQLAYQRLSEANYWACSAVQEHRAPGPPEQDGVVSREPAPRIVES